MKTLYYLVRMITLSWLLMLCYSSHAAAAVAGDGSDFGVQSSMKCIDHERKVLLRFKQGIVSDYCGLLSSWGDHEDCCLWYGIRCSNRTGHVIMLRLQGGGYDDRCLEGKLDPSLFDLKHLKYLDLSFNNFNQATPLTIDSLTNLEHLNFSNAGDYNTLSAKSLQWVSRLTMLREIDLSNCNLSEATDWFQTINKLPSLSVLHLDDCNLPSKIIPSSLSYINSSSALRVVSLSGNNLNDTSILQWLFNLSNHLEYLDLSYNSFSGPLPSEFGSMHSLSYLSLSRNNLEGLIPDSFSNLNSLKVLYLSHNKLHGPISKIVSNLSNLQILDLAGNNLAGDMSNVIQALSFRRANNPLLESLDLSMNQFRGSIPDMISTFSSMRVLYLYGNHLNGIISQNIGKLSKLQILDVSNTSLKGTLNQSHFLNLSKLEELYLSDNPELVVNINTGWTPPFQLNIISLRSCKLGPSFPNWLLTQTNFSYLDISNAHISDKMPSTFWAQSLSSNLQFLNVSHNEIHGVLPNLPTALDIMATLDLSSNYFEGSIPLFLGAYGSSLYLNDNKFSDATLLLCPTLAYTLLSDLDLSNNLLSGKLPDCWMKFDQLQYLHLENNKFSGNIPPSIGALKQLQYLHLQNNSFSGELPESLLSCTSLVILDLGYNSLTGYIPPSIGNAIEGLGVLNLRGNRFYGRLPLSLCQLSNLQVLDLAINHISGTIPNCICNLTAMITGSSNLDFGQSGTSLGDEPITTKVETAVIEWKREEQNFGHNLEIVYTIDLSNNELEGEIPYGISKLTQLISLDLSRNKLTGSIVSDIGQLKSLELLDLSNNYLSGVIPISLAEVSYLGTLDLSNNNLSGRIPLSTQLQGFDPSSYKGNPLLCGAPLQVCPGDEPPAKAKNEDTFTKKNEQKGKEIYPGLYISLVLGFIIGFWGVCGTLVVKRSWRHAFFRFFDDTKDKLYVMVAVNVARAMRKP